MSLIKRSVLLFIASESIFFILLILSFLHYQTTHSHAEAGPSLLDVMRTGKFSVLLLLSSLTVWLSIRSMRQDKPRSMVFWLLITIALGGAFLYGQGTEWWGLIQRNVTISRDLFGSTFFTLTGFHGFHVFVGLLMLGTLMVLSAFGAIQGKAQEAADGVSIYWHFVDGVWVVVFTVIYLVPRL